MGKCVVKDCDSKPHKHSKESGIKFHTVPKDAARRDKWVEIIRLLRKEADWLPTKTTVVCSKHLPEDETMKAEEQ